MGLELFNLGKENTFATYHPLVNFLYFVAVIGIGMFSMNPFFLALTFTASFAYSLLLNGWKALRFTLCFLIPIIVIMAVVNPLFNHRGVTVLFYLNDNAMTLEAILYGLAAAVMMTSILIWFSCANKVITPDKFLYLFGRVLPVLSLLLSMSFRFIPLLKNRYREISMGQRCMGRQGGGLIQRGRLLAKKVSILISWSLEAAIETSDSMESRGYGLKGRTCFHLFRFDRRDGEMLALILLLTAVVIAGMTQGVHSMIFYPALVLPPTTWLTGLTIAAYGALLLLPLFIEGKGALKWKRWRSAM